MGFRVLPQNASVPEPPLSKSNGASVVKTLVPPVRLSPMNFQARQQKLRDHLATTQFDALLVSHLPNIRYL